MSLRVGEGLNSLFSRCHELSNMCVLGLGFIDITNISGLQSTLKLLIANILFHLRIYEVFEILHSPPQNDRWKYAEIVFFMFRVLIEHCWQTCLQLYSNFSVLLNLEPISCFWGVPLVIVSFMFYDQKYLNEMDD